MENTPRAVELPAQAREDPSAHENLRVWGAHRCQHVVMDIGDWDPETWGICVMDIIRHVAAAYEQLGKGDAETLTITVREAMAKACDEPLEPHVTLAKPREARPHELPIPAAARDDPKAFEILTHWSSDDSSFVVLDPNIWKDIRTWGLVIAELISNIATGFVEAGLMDEDTAWTRIGRGYIAERESPTDMPRPGRF